MGSRPIARTNEEKQVTEREVISREALRRTLNEYDLTQKDINNIIEEAVKQTPARYVFPKT